MIELNQIIHKKSDGVNALKNQIDESKITKQKLIGQQYLQMNEEIDEKESSSETTQCDTTKQSTSAGKQSCINKYESETNQSQAGSKIALYFS